MKIQIEDSVFSCKRGVYGIFIIKCIARQNARQFARHFNFNFKSGAVPFLILLD